MLSLRCYVLNFQEGDLHITSYEAFAKEDRSLRTV